jgi:oligopeptide transport system permease protein
MLSFIARRVLIAIPTLWVIITVCFFLMRAAPGGPFDGEAPVPPEILANMRAAYDLDKPIFPVSAQNGLSAIILAMLIGIPLGIWAALRQNSATDFSVMGFAMTGIVVPSFVMAPILILIFAIVLKDTPFHLPAGTWEDGAIRHRILPVFCLSLVYIAYLSRITRASMIEALRQNYVRTARAKGLPFRQVVVRHALKTAMVPVVTFLGPGIAFLLTGSMVVETIFQLPGIGRYFVQGALNRDYTLVMGVTILSAALIILANMIVDVLYGLLDPRVRYE